MPATLGTRGKWCESKVRGALKDLSVNQGFNFMRLPDARAGSFTPTTADFLVGHKTPYRRKAWMLEAKEVEHEFRLPRKNYPQDQRSRVRSWEMAGFESLVVVAFLPLKGAAYKATTPMFRATNLAYYTGDDTSSWDMRDLPLLTLAQALTPLTNLP